MKIEVRNNESPAFAPVVIEITIESKEELQELWHRLNLAPATVKEAGGDDAIVPPCKTDDLWEVINEIAKSRGVRMFEHEAE